MTVEELETRYRAVIDILGNQLQNALIRLSQTETQISQMGDSLQDLNTILEDFIQQQREAGR